MVRYRRRVLEVVHGLFALLFVFALLPAGDTYSAPPQSPPDGRFGVVEAFWSPDQATEMGVGWERVVFWWKSLQPNSPGDWNPFYFPDASLAQELAQGREVAGLLISTPAWAGGGNDPRLPPKNLYLPYDDPNNYWGAFVKNIAARYRGRIDTWIIWNEPDIWDALQDTSTWLGSEADYYQLLKIAYQAARSVNPKARIVFAGLTYWWDKAYGRELYLKRVLDIAAKDPTARANGYYFDVANAHIYDQPVQAYLVPQQFKQVLAEHNLTKPIWLSEVNVVPYDDPLNPLPRSGHRASLEEQASFVVQAMALSLAGGAERIALYKMRDDPSQPLGSEPYGLTRSNGSARPAFAAFRAASRYLAGAKEAKWTHIGDLNAVVVQRNGEVTTVLWNGGHKPVAAQVSASAAEGLIVDKYGFAATVRPVGGKYALLLPAATAAAPAGEAQKYFIGGDPFLIVESAPGALDKVVSLSGGEAPPAQDKPDPAVSAPSAWDRSGETAARAEEDQKAKMRREELAATLVARAQSSLARRDWQSAAATLQELDEVDPQSPKGRELHSILWREVKTAELGSHAAEFYRLQDWPGAVEALRQLVALHPQDPTFKAQLAGAVAELEKAQLIDLAESLSRQGSVNEARHAYEQVLSRDPLNRKARDGIANLRTYR